jgi:hypothetical protein
MTRSRFPRFLTLLSVTALTLGAVGCSNSQSPTEPTLDTPTAATKSVASISGESRGRGRGGDDAATNDRRGRGRRNDDPAGDDRGRGRRGRGADDPAQPQQPARAQEFEGAVVSVNGGTLILSGGVRIVVNGQTQWSSRGDLFSLDQVARSVAAGKPTKVEGRGVRQADGSILAQTIKAENEDEDDD